MIKQVIMYYHMSARCFTGNLNCFPVIRVDHRKKFAEAKGLAQLWEVKQWRQSSLQKK